MTVLNRAQRRALRKHKPARVIDKRRAWARIGLNMLSTSFDDISTDAITKLLMPVYASITSMTDGNGTEADFLALVQANALGFCLAARLYEFGNAKEEIAALQPIFENAANALESIGTRFNRLGKYGFSGNELSKIRMAVTTLHDLCGIADKGHMLSAQRSALDLVNSWIDASHKLEDKQELTATRGTRM